MLKTGKFLAKKRVTKYTCNYLIYNVEYGEVEPPTFPMPTGTLQPTEPFQNKKKPYLSVKPLIFLVEITGIEPVTFPMPIGTHQPT
jgi:hypothetical protein